MLLKVTQEHIDQRIVGEPVRGCPAALALIDARFHDVRVGARFMHCRERPTFIPLPKSLTC